MRYLLFILLCLPLFTKGQTNVSNNLQPNTPKILDNRAGIFSSGAWRPFVSTTEANTNINPAYRANSLTVAIGSPTAFKEYWYYGGTNDTNLKPKIDTNLIVTRYYLDNFYRSDSSVYVTIARLQDSINIVRDSIPPRYNLTAGTNVSIVGAYPNQTISFSGSGGSESTVWGNIPGTLSNQTDLQAALDAKVFKNANITGATKTKITYDAKGLVTSGADATTTDIAEGTRLYYTETRVSNNVDVAANTASRHSALTLGTANGLSLATQQLSLGLSSTSTTGALSNTDWNSFNTKQTALGFTPVPDTRTISTSSPLSGGGTLNVDRTISIATAQADNATKGAAGFMAADFDAASGIISIDYVNGQHGSAISTGFLTASDWALFNGKQAALGFTPENVNNKSTSTSLGTSNTLYPTQNAVKTYVDAAIIGAGGYTDEAAQDAVAAMASSEFTYVDATPSFSINTIAQSKITNLTADLALLAPKASPTFTGVPLAPTATAGTNTTQLATTAFVTNAVSASGGGTVSNFIFTNANGVAGTVTNSTSTPTLSLALNAITPTTVVASGNITGLNLSGTNTGDQTNISGNAGTVTNGVYTTGSYSNPTWLTSLAWSKITGTPTTLAGYGIVDGVAQGRTISTTPPLAGGGDLSINRTLSIANAAADGSTKGAASFQASDFDASSGNITIDYTNGQTASGSTKGFLTSTDWSTFNSKQGAITLTTTGTGAATFVANTLNIPTPTGTGTVTSVALTTPTGLTITGSPITSSGTLALTLQTGYSIPTVANQTNWTAGFDKKINSLAFTGTTTKTLTLNQQDGGTVTGTFTDNNSGGTVTSSSVATANGFAGTIANNTTTPAITLSTTVTGLLKGNGTAISAATANTDYQSPITLTTTGSGVSTFNGTTLNIPSAWSISGNAGVTSGFLGTTDANDLLLKTNNATRLRITSNGEVSTSYSDASYSRTFQANTSNIYSGVTDNVSGGRSSIDVQSAILTIASEGATSNDVSKIVLSPAAFAIEVPNATHELTIGNLQPTLNSFDSIAVFDGDFLKKAPRYTGAPTVTLSTGAGTGATYSIDGDSHAGVITLVTGTSIVANSLVLRLDLTAFASPSGYAAMVLFPFTTTTIGADVFSSHLGIPASTAIIGGTTGLAAGRTYTWNYIIEGY